MAVVLLSGAAPRNDAAEGGRGAGAGAPAPRPGPPPARRRWAGRPPPPPPARAGPRAPPGPRRVRWLPAAADVAAARALAAERVGEGLRADLEGRAQERHAVGAEGEAVYRDPHAIAAPAAGLERDEGAAAAVAETPAGEDRALDGASHRGVDHDAARVDQQHARRGGRHAGGQVERSAPHEPALRAGERHAEPVHVHRLAGGVAARRERARVAEITDAVAVGVGLCRVRDSGAVVLRV